MADVFQALRKTVINSFTAVAWQLRSRLHVFIGYVSVQSDVPERYSGFATSLVKSDYPHVHINRKGEDEKKRKRKKQFGFTISLQRTGSCGWNGYVSCMAGSKSTFGQQLSTSQPQNYK